MIPDPDDQLYAAVRRLEAQRDGAYEERDAVLGLLTRVVAGWLKGEAELKGGAVPT